MILHTHARNFFFQIRICATLAINKNFTIFVLTSLSEFLIRIRWHDQTKNQKRSQCISFEISILVLSMNFYFFFFFAKKKLLIAQQKFLFGWRGARSLALPQTVLVSIFFFRCWTLNGSNQTEVENRETTVFIILK